MTHLTLQHFRNLPPEKQAQILRAARAEFIAHGFDLASTNQIVEQAGISKGVLFKYFTDKEGLFLYLCQHSADLVVAELQRSLPHLPRDFWGALRELNLVEMTLRETHRAHYDLMQMVLRTPEHPVYQKAASLFQTQATAVYAHLMQNISTSGLRPEVPMAQVLLMVRWVVEGLKAQYLHAQAPLDSAAFLRDWDTYINLLKTGLQG